MKPLLKWSWAPSWALALLALTVACNASAMAQRTFATPDEAVQALISALERNDVTALTLLLGENSEKAITSGDEVADAICDLVSTGASLCIGPRGLITVEDPPQTPGIS